MSAAHHEALNDNGQVIPMTSALVAKIATGELPVLISKPILEFLACEFPPQRTLLSPWLRSSGLTMVHAWRGIGKTHFAIGVAHAVASGSCFLKWQTDKPARVLYVDGEMPAQAMQERFRAALATGSLSDPNYLRLITPDLLAEGQQVPNLLTAQGQAAIENDLRDCDLVIFDNVATLFRTEEDQNSVSTWLAAQDYILGLRRRGLAVMLVDHDNKSGGNRGTSAKHDVLDTVIQLKRPSDYQSAQGARFEVHFTKHRGFWGRDALPFEAHLAEKPSGPAWTVTEIEDALLDRVAVMIRDGCTERVIREELQIGGGTLAGLKKKLKERECQAA